MFDVARHCYKMECLNIRNPQLMMSSEAQLNSAACEYTEGESKLLHKTSCQDGRGVFSMYCFVYGRRAFLK